MIEKQFDYKAARITRRKLLKVSGLGAISTVFATACGSDFLRQEAETIMKQDSLQNRNEKAFQKGRLFARPTNSSKEKAKLGLQPLNIDKGREVFLYQPKSYQPDKPAPFALMLHGAGGSAQQGISLLQNYADQSGIILLAPKSFHPTWDVIADDYGVDVEFINRALEHTFKICAIDKSRLAIGGFSDGASYALSLGVINGELFSHIIAFSPGFMAPTEQAGKPRIFVSHGTQDRVLPIDRCSRRLVPQLNRAGYTVLYKEFEGPHTIPAEIARDSIQWLIK
jgi:phospholipase/carboxylesterase